jgi:ABC-2 type transport system ATP-binding protein
MTNAPAVRVTGLTKRYGEVTAVHGLDLTIAPGEVVALLGPNGAGKSTTIDMMLGLSRPDAGTVSVYGVSPATAIRDGKVGAQLQSGGLLPDVTVAEIVGLSAALHKRNRPVAGVLRTAGLTDLAKRRVSALSGGQQQRVRFAMALVADPDLIVLDEPTTGLDVEARRAFWAAMREETEQGRTVLFATHYLEGADDYADRIVLMHAGSVVADGTSAQIKSVVSGRTIRATLPGADMASLMTLRHRSASAGRLGRLLARMPCAVDQKLRTASPIARTSTGLVVSTSTTGPRPTTVSSSRHSSGYRASTWTGCRADVRARAS